MDFFRAYIQNRENKKQSLDQKRSEYERLRWEEYKNAEFNLLGSLTKLFNLLAIVKSNLAIICPVEARACYAFIWDCMSDAIQRFWGLSDSSIAESDATLKPMHPPARESSSQPIKIFSEEGIQTLESMLSKVGGNGDSTWGTNYIAYYLYEKLWGPDYAEILQFDLANFRNAHWKTYFRQRLCDLASKDELSELYRKVPEHIAQLEKHSDYANLRTARDLRDMFPTEESFKTGILAYRYIEQLQMIPGSPQFKNNVKRNIVDNPGQGHCMYYALVLGLAKSIADGNDLVFSKWEELTEQKWEKSELISLSKFNYEKERNNTKMVTFFHKCQLALRKVLRSQLGTDIASFTNESERVATQSVFLYNDYTDYLQNSGSVDSSNFFKAYGIQLTQEERARCGKAYMLKVFDFEEPPTEESVLEKYNQLNEKSRYNFLVRYGHAYYYFESGRLECLLLSKETIDQLHGLVNDFIYKSPYSDEKHDAAWQLKMVLNPEAQDKIEACIGRVCPLSYKEILRLFLKRRSLASNPELIYSNSP